MKVEWRQACSHRLELIALNWIMCCIQLTAVVRIELEISNKILV